MKVTGYWIFGHNFSTRIHFKVNLAGKISNQRHGNFFEINPLLIQDHDVKLPSKMIKQIVEV